MVKYFKIDGKDYHTKDSKDLTVNEFIEIKKLYSELEFVKIISKISNIEKVENKLTNMDFVFFNFDEYFDDILKFKIKEISEFKIKDFTKMKFGKYIDLDYYSKNFEDDEKLIKIVARILKGDSKDNIEKVKNMLVIDVVNIYNKYDKFTKDIANYYPLLFTKIDFKKEGYKEEDIENLKNRNKKMSWLNTAYSLMNDNILNYDKILNQPVLKILNFLAWKEEEYLKLKNKNRNNV